MRILPTPPIPRQLGERAPGQPGGRWFNSIPGSQRRDASWWGRRCHIPLFDRSEGFDPLPADMKTHFRGRVIYAVDDNNRYPSVRWPEHPVAMANGTARIHRVVALEKYGVLPEGYHVHHRDGDIWNWSRCNLDLLRASDHARFHWVQVYDRALNVILECPCGRVITTTASRPKKYCSRPCGIAAQERGRWPDAQQFTKMYATLETTAIARAVGVSDTAVTKHARRIAKETGKSLTKFRTRRSCA